MRIEQRAFMVDEKADVADLAGELDKAFAEGWRYVSHLPAGRGQILILERSVTESASNE